MRIVATGLFLCTLLGAASCATSKPVEERDSDHQEFLDSLPRGLKPEAPDEKTSDEKKADEEKSTVWKPPDPKADKFDWVRLKSGEWLKGEIKVLQGHELDFDSEELNDLEIDWEDVAELRSSRNNTATFDGRVTATGPLLVRDGVILVGRGEEQLRFAREALVSIIPGEVKEVDYWSGRGNLSLTFRSGNADQTDVVTRATIWRRAPWTRTTLDYAGSISTTDGKETINNHRGSGQFDVLLSRRFYLTPTALEYFRDRISNIEHRVTPSAGAGYLIIDEPDVEWNLDLLGGYRYTEFGSVEAGEDRTEETATAIASTRFDIELTKTLDLILEYKIDVGLSDLNDTNHHAVATVSVDMTKVLDLDVTFIWDRVGKPERDADGDTPEKDDFRLLVGVGFDF